MLNDTVGCDLQFGLHRLVKYLKGTSSRLPLQALPRFQRELPGLWTNRSCGAATGGVSLERLQRYVEGRMNR
jgi:putative transposase